VVTLHSQSKISSYSSRNGLNKQSLVEELMQPHIFRSKENSQYHGLKYREKERGGGCMRSI
jgi:hypothetical protein